VVLRRGIDHPAGRDVRERERQGQAPRARRQLVRREELLPRRWSCAVPKTPPGLLVTFGLRVDRPARWQPVQRRVEIIFAEIRLCDRLACALIGEFIRSRVTAQSWRPGPMPGRFLGEALIPPG
jgi:hypothetical protein